MTNQDVKYGLNLHSISAFVPSARLLPLSVRGAVLCPGLCRREHLGGEEEARHIPAQGGHVGCKFSTERT